MGYSPRAHTESDTTARQHRQVQVVGVNYAPHASAGRNRRGAQTFCLRLAFLVLFQEHLLSGAPFSPPSSAPLSRSSATKHMKKERETGKKRQKQPRRWRCSC